MSVESQYYVENMADGGSVSERIERFFANPICPKLEASTGSSDKVTPLVHAPYSQVHLERVIGEPKGEFVRNLDGNVCLHPQTGNEMQIPYSVEVAKDELTKAFVDESSLLAEDKREILWREAHFLSKRPLTGDYHPSQLGSMSDGESVDPTLFILTTAMKVAKQRRSEIGNSDAVFVMHPDILYFLSRGDARKVREVALHLENALSALELKSAYENVYFSNKTFSDSLSWMTNPLGLRNILPENAGICLDVVHLERAGWSKERIVGAIKDLSRNVSETFVVHVDSTYGFQGTGKEYIQEAYKNGVPVAYEPREHS